MSRLNFIRSVSALDARTDAHIQEYFVLTDAIRAVRDMAAPGFAVIGLKGTGKTTLYRALVEDWHAREGQTTLGLSTDSSAFENYFDKINCLQFERSVRIGMMLFILRAIDERAAHFSADKGLLHWFRKKEQLLAGRSKIGTLLKRFDGLSIMGVGLNWRASDGQQTFNPIPADEASRLRSLLHEFADTGHRLRIVIDDPDRLFTKGTSFDPHLLAGYILGTNWIASEFDYVEFVHVLKSSVYDALWEVEEMANLPHDYFHYISWKESELKQILEERIRFSGVDRGSVFEDVDTLSIPDLTERLRNGPRDLLRYVEIILKSSPDARVSLTSIKEAEPAFKQEARRQMESVYSGVYEGLDVFSEYVFKRGGVMSINDFGRRFDEMRLGSLPSSLDYGQPWLKRADRAFRTLVDAGVVDVQINGRWIRPFEAEYFRVNSRAGNTLFRRNAVFT